MKWVLVSFVFVFGIISGVAADLGIRANDWWYAVPVLFNVVAAILTTLSYPGDKFGEESKLDIEIALAREWRDRLIAGGIAPRDAKNVVWEVTGHEV